MNKKGLVLLAVLALGLASQAEATDWIVFNGSSQRCENAKADAEQTQLPAVASPLAMRDAMRNRPGWEGTKIYHTAQGTVVELRWNGNRNLTFFSSLAGCHAFVSAARLKGVLPNLKDLK